MEGMLIVGPVEAYELTEYSSQEYERNGTWIYEQHPFWCTGYTFWELHSEAPDLFLHLSKSDLVLFKGDLNHRKVRNQAFFEDH